MTDRPNVVLVITDQQRADTMGYAGDPVAHTPNLDKLAAEGVVFRRCCISLDGSIRQRAWDMDFSTTGTTLWSQLCKKYEGY